MEDDTIGIYWHWELGVGDGHTTVDLMIKYYCLLLRF